MKTKIYKVLALLLCTIAIFPMKVHAEGDPNVDIGGGGWGDGTNTNFWSVGDEGVRVTVVDVITGDPISASVDISNKNTSTIKIHFGKVSKSSYRNGTVLQPKGGKYSAFTPNIPLPTIISTNSGGKASLAAIKAYFTDKQMLIAIAGYVGMDFDTMINGNYKLLIEPVAYVTYNGVRTAFTATEAALYDQQTGGGLRKKMPSLTHKNLPLSLFLEVSDLGYPAWTGSRTEKVEDEQIISSLGVGIIRFTDTPGNSYFPPADYEYRTDTDVITSVTVRGGQSDPDNPVNVYFDILGSTYTVSNVYYPKDGQQIVWVKWHTPSTPQQVVIHVSANHGAAVSKGNITANINSLEDNPPPNPVADDRNDSFNKSLLHLPANNANTSTSWTVWRCKWHEKWVWHADWKWIKTEHTEECSKDCKEKHGYWKDEGEYVDEGWWDFYLDGYSATLSGGMNLTTDTLNPTANGDMMKSGYGVNVKVNSSISTNNYGAVTGAQNAISYFPEFYYTCYWRVLDLTGKGYNSELQFKTNPYSTYNARTHFTPIWYPDGEYKVYTYLIDAWTPNGELRMNLDDSVTVKGNLWSDWHIAPKNVD